MTATWVPWTYGRLAAESGYGAGIRSPGWYEHLWTTQADIAATFFAKAGRAFRKADLLVSSAHLIEATRLADALAAMRGRREPILEDIVDATRAVMTDGSDVPLAVVRRDLIVGTRIGKVPEAVPTAPLAADFERRRKRAPPQGLRHRAAAGPRPAHRDGPRPEPPAPPADPARHRLGTAAPRAAGPRGGHVPRVLEAAVEAGVRRRPDRRVALRQHDRDRGRRRRRWRLAASERPARDADRAAGARPARLAARRGRGDRRAPGRGGRGRRRRAGAHGRAPAARPRHALRQRARDGRLDGRGDRRRDRDPDLRRARAGLRVAGPGRRRATWAG